MIVRTLTANMTGGRLIMVIHGNHAFERRLIAAKPEGWRCGLVT